MAADLALGPFVAAIAGPGPSMALALPSPQGLPVVYDSALDPIGEGSKGTVPDEVMATWSPWVASLAGVDGWLVLAVSASAMESLASFHERVAASFLGWAEGRRRLMPEAWEARRREARERGLPLDQATVDGLEGWAKRLGVPWPAGVEG